MFEKLSDFSRQLSCPAKEAPHLMRIRCGASFAQDNVIGEQLRFDIVYNKGSRKDKLRANRHLLTENN